MKRYLAAFIVLAGFGTGLFGAGSRLRFEAGAFSGPRYMTGSDISAAYGQGFVYNPYAAIQWGRFLIGGGYEEAKASRGEIGLYEESSSLRIRGFDLFVGYVFTFRIVAPYLKIGYGRYSYQQTIDSLYVGSDGVNQKKWTVTIAGGARFRVFKHLLLAGEVKYTPLKARPFDEEVDLGGLRLLAGIGFSL